ncbi:Serine proteases trypsin domain [Trinorchestia longiramus]|nr:Serine proteases trypsin domain [Trinorchestia longiramus]
MLWPRLLSSAFTVAMTVEVVRAARTPRHMLDRPQQQNALDAVQYPLCSVGDVQAACVHNFECERHGGRFAGYCSGDRVCCVVEKTCWATTSAHSVTFKNPSFPKSDEDPVLCPLNVKLGRGVCAVRVDLNVLELALYEDGVCIRDTLTLLGSTDGIATPVCGNMTKYSTTFPVKALGKVTVSLVAQSTHRFSITVTQLDCDSVPVFISPTYAGVRNEDAEKYHPPKTTKDKKTKGKPTKITVRDEAETTTALNPGVRDAGNEDGMTTQTPEEADDNPEIEMPEGDSTTENPDVATITEATTDVPDSTTQLPLDPADIQTTLKVGKYPSRKTTPSPGVVIGDAYEDFEEDESVYEETLDVTPAVSAFKDAFRLKVQDKCWLYEEEPERPVFRVVGGFGTGVNEYPWQVALVYRKKFFCGGSLISDRFVLTAAHCVFGSFKLGVDQLRVSLGDHDLKTKNDTTNVVRRVKRVIWHLHYSPHININDIALFELAEPVTFNYSVSAVKLPFDSDDEFHAVNATVTGWGRYSIRTKKTSPYLKEYTAPIFEAEKCAAAWKKFPKITAYADKHICMDIKMGTPCHGDSGGPLVACIRDSCTQVGLVSFGFPLCTNVGLPAVFTRLTYYRPWLNRNLATLNARPV